MEQKSKLQKKRSESEQVKPTGNILRYNLNKDIRCAIFAVHFGKYFYS